MILLTKIGLYAIAGYLLLIVIMFFLQRRLLYFPDPRAPGESTLQLVGLDRWPAAGDACRGYVASRPARYGGGTVVVFHGNAGAAWNRNYYVRALEPLRYQVLLAEYPGYGGRAGALGEKSFVKDAVEIVRRVHDEFGGPIFLIGESLGCGVAAAVSGHSTVPIKGIALFTPWDTLPDLVQSIYWFLPGRWLVRDRYDNAACLKDNRSRRIAVIVAGRDEVIPKRHGLKLYAALCGQKRLWILETAGHNTWPNSADADFWREVMDFLDWDESK